MTDRPLGPPLGNWKTPPFPGPDRLEGRFALLERLSAKTHAQALYDAFAGHDWVWDYMPDGPFATPEAFADWMQAATARDDILFYAIFDRDTGSWGGFASFLRIKPASGSIEVGYIAMSPHLQRTRAATEAIFLMMQWAFDAGYRRFEWKCDALNAPSRRAAQRFGFTYEGTFRQATVVKGRNRDTAWFAMIDSEWPALRTAYADWLASDNFDAAGGQKSRLSVLTAQALASASNT
ncbi:GNAT family N-acetyltransferase [Roseovarius sp. PS-C2]|uniref:GNAT family N-acetyltransferase n=1 Tax=Roseovarius sp. PS-C2 TaxID=2820814 RepID=UPI001C0E10BC|nr:GNAT family protein [Roseovarius sp. PS-C2]MBU3258990.1 GNAT family N-acetyltransferase [Roseovarius sp. PS-C2]